MVSSSSAYTAPARWSTTTTFVLTSLLAASSTTTLVSAQSQSQSAYSSPSYNQASSTASASNSTQSASSSSTNPLIPASISTKCQSFLASLNGDSHLSSCTSPLLSALEAFQPSSSMNSYSPSTSSSVAETLATFCAAPSCDDTRIRGWLNQFNGNCSTELQAGNEVVLGSYDSLYILTPLKQSICEEDGVGGYCLIDIAKGDVPSTSPTSSSSSNSTSSPSASSAASASSQAVAAPSPSALTVNSTTSDKFVMLAATSGDSSIEAPAPPSLYVQITSVAKRLLRRQQASAEVWGSSSASSSMQASPSASSTNMTTSAAGSSNSSSSSSGSTNSFDLPSLLPNSQTYRTLSLPFLFLTSSLPSSTLCTPCTKQILTNYISFESRQPYALGLANSPILGGQGELWKGTGEKCGSGFLSNIMEMSGQQELTGSASTTNILTLSAGLTGLVGIAMTWF
ncbi:hypothetical protein JCM5353_003733 [Sporobolomyces roseus]